MTAQRHPSPITSHLMVINTRLEYINIRAIKNRRFMFNPKTGIFILGDEKYGRTILGSHAEEFRSSEAAGYYDDYLRGWIGCGANYRNGIIHFAPSIDKESFDRGFDTLQMFARMGGITPKTVIRGFCELCEEKISDLMPSSFK